jgi:hypothetical protein
MPIVTASLSDIKAIAFLFDGHRLNSEQTPDQVYGARSPTSSHGMCILFKAQKIDVSKPWTLTQQFQLEMEDGDEIDAMLHQTGGCLQVI